MGHITANQIRAARALLDLSQRDVIEATGLGVNTLSGIEKGAHDPSPETADKLEQFFTGAGITFSGNDGVAFKSYPVIYTGRLGFQKFYDDVYQTAKSSGGSIRLFNGRPDKLIEFLGEEFYKMHAERMAKIKNNFDFQVIIRQEDSNLIGAGFARYKSLPEDEIFPDTVYVYGDKVAFIEFGEDVRCEVTKRQSFADFFRYIFGYLWDSAGDIE